MKRSEMRKLLVDELLGDTGEIWYLDKPDSWTNSEAQAEEIIKAVEKLGMLPPSYTTVLEVNKKTKEITVDKYVNKWEPESDDS